MLKNPPANAGDIRDMGSIPGSERSSGGGHGNPLQYSCLENSMDRGVWQATVHGVTKSWTQLKWLMCTHANYIQWSTLWPLKWLHRWLCLLTQNYVYDNVEWKRYVKSYVCIHAWSRLEECLENVSSDYLWMVLFQMSFTFFVFFMVLVSFSEHV